MPGRAEAYRVFFGLAALWAAVSVLLWLWQSGPDLPLSWHVAEMGLGFVSALIAGYALSACSAWSGRAPLRGSLVLALAFIWLSARVAALVQPVSGASLPAMLNATVFAAIAGLVLREWLHGQRQGRSHAVPPFIIAICLTLGLGTLFAQGFHIGLILLPIWLVTLIGSRMLAAFLAAAGQRAGALDPLPFWPLAHAALVSLGAALVASGDGHGVIMPAQLLATSALLTGFMLSLPLRHLRRDVLLSMMALALACIPVGLRLLALAYSGWAGAPGGAVHLLMIGSMGGMGVAVIARSNAIRVSDRLKARRSAVAGFACVLLAALLRMADLTAPAAASWSLGWGLVLLAHLRGCAGPVERPIFSARSDATAPSLGRAAKSR